MAPAVVRPIRFRRALATLVAVAAAASAVPSTSSVTPASARDGDRATVPFRYALSAKKHGKKGIRLTRLVARACPPMPH